MPLTGHLKLDDIPGESTEQGHEGEIDVFGLSWGVERSASAQVGRGRARARADVGPMVFEKFLDKSSTKIAEATSKGRSFAEATVFVTRRARGGRSVDYLKFSLENVIFTSYEFDAGEPDDPDPRLTEAVVMDFSKMTI
ncbi:MAG: Hcp family type VI secretion system effector, partial [Roseobacter sp.]